MNDNKNFAFKGGPALSNLKNDFYLWVGGDGLDMNQQHQGGFGSMHAKLPILGRGAKNGSKTENLTESDRV